MGNEGIPREPNTVVGRESRGVGQKPIFLKNRICLFFFELERLKDEN